jgi:hypothetical protein
MRTATSNPDDERRAVLSARIPERLTDEQRRRKYDEPLTTMLREAGFSASVRGFSQTGGDGQGAWVGIEVTLTGVRNGASVAQCLAGLGAPPETAIQIETESASLEFTLAEVKGSPGR